jgi:hypothetical protein
MPGIAFTQRGLSSALPGIEVGRTRVVPCLRAVRAPDLRRRAHHRWRRTRRVSLEALEIVGESITPAGLIVLDGAGPLQSGRLSSTAHLQSGRPGGSYGILPEMRMTGAETRMESPMNPRAGVSRGPRSLDDVLRGGGWNTAPAAKAAVAPQSICEQAASVSACNDIREARADNYNRP